MPRRKAKSEAPGSASQVVLADAEVAARLGDVAAAVAEIRRAELGAIAAAAVAHEVRNLLTPVRARLELAILGMGDQALVERSIRDALKGVERIGRAADAVLSVIGGRMDIGTGADPAQALRMAVGWVETAGFSVERHIEHGVHIRMSQVGLEQVLVNLLMNARTAMGGRGIVVVRINVETPNKVVIEVEDHGAGMRVSNMFASSPAGKTDPKGSGALGAKRGGIGLIICRHLVEAVGGTMGARSQEGVGTVVRIELDAMPASEAGTKAA